MESLKWLALVALAVLPCSEGKTWLRANGNSANTYSLINSVLGGTAYEVPDCAHSSYGPHITQQNDTTLNRPIFAFHLHVTPDNDGCNGLTDRQRVEIKTYGPSPSHLKGFEGDFVTLSWNIRINSQYQASSKFCHLHQIKDSGGQLKTPLITLTPRNRSSGAVLEVIYVGRDGVKSVLTQDTFSKFTGKWVRIVEELTYARSGKYKVVVSRTDNGQELMRYENNNIDLWRDGADFIRPKWGIYRSLEEPAALRDEHVHFDSFCIGKGTADKCS